MDTKKAISNIDFADASYKSLEMSNDELFVYINSWDDKTIKISFFNPIKFTFKIGGFIEGFYEIGDDFSFLNEILEEYYEKIPQDHPFKVFVIRDINDDDFIKVVAESATAVKTKNNIERET